MWRREHESGLILRALSWVYLARSATEGLASMPHDKVLHAIELYGTKVAPAVRKAVGARR